MRMSCHGRHEDSMPSPEALEHAIGGHCSRRQRSSIAPAPAPCHDDVHYGMRKPGAARIAANSVSQPYRQAVAVTLKQWSGGLRGSARANVDVVRVLAQEPRSIALSNPHPACDHRESSSPVDFLRPRKAHEQKRGRSRCRHNTCAAALRPCRSGSVDHCQPRPHSI